MDNIINELKKLDKQAWADYGIIDNIFEKNGMDLNSVNDKFYDIMDEIFTGDDIVAYIFARVEQNEGYIEATELDDEELSNIKEDINIDKEDMKYYSNVGGALYQYGGGVFKFYQLTNEALIDMLEFINKF